MEDEARREVEKMDKLQGFMYLHAAGGGTGSGVATKVMKMIS